MAQDAIDRIVTLAAIGEQVVEAVKVSGLLKRKPGRKKGKKRKYTRRKPVEEKVVAPKVAKPKKPKPAPVEEPMEPESEEEDD